MSRDDLRRKKDEEQRRENRKYGVPVNIATSWEPAEDAALRDEYQRGMDLLTIAQVHERGEMGIRERLVYLGLLDITAGEVAMREPVGRQPDTSQEPLPFPEQRAPIEKQQSLFS